MAGKSILPLLLLAGAGAVLLTKSKPSKKKAKAPKEVTSTDVVVASGSVQRTGIPSPGDNPRSYHWRVRSEDDVYIGEARRPPLREPDPDADFEEKWTAVGEADTAADAEEMVLAWIEKQDGYGDPVDIVDGGVKTEWEWRVITDPERGFIGQYKLKGAQWLNGVEGPEYNDPFKFSLWAVAIKDWESKQTEPDVQRPKG